MKLYETKDLGLSMLTELTKIDVNVLEVALTHLIEELEDTQNDEDFNLNQELASAKAMYVALGNKHEGRQIMKTKIVPVVIKNTHDNISRRNAETISDIVYDTLDELGYIDDDNLMNWSWNIEVSLEIKED